MAREVIFTRSAEMAFAALPWAARVGIECALERYAVDLFHRHNVKRVMNSPPERAYSRIRLGDYRATVRITRDRLVVCVLARESRTISCPVTLEMVRTALRPLVPELERDYGVTSIELFGSYVRGEQDGESDLDLLVEFDPERELSLFDLIGLEQELSDRLGIRVDLVEKRSIKPGLRDRILNEAVPL
jgi:uncharacterized protein